MVFNVNLLTKYIKFHEFMKIINYIIPHYLQGHKG